MAPAQPAARAGWSAAMLSAENPCSHAPPGLILSWDPCGFQGARPGQASCAVLVEGAPAGSDPACRGTRRVSGVTHAGGSLDKCHAAHATSSRQHQPALGAGLRTGLLGRRGRQPPRVVSHLPGGRSTARRSRVRAAASAGAAAGRARWAGRAERRRAGPLSKRLQVCCAAPRRRAHARCAPQRAAYGAGGGRRAAVVRAMATCGRPH